MCSRGTVGPTRLIWAALAIMAGLANAPALAQDKKLGGIVWVSPNCVPEQATEVAAGGALLFGFLPSLIGEGLKFGGNALVKAGAPKTRTASAMTSTDFYAVRFTDSGADPDKTYAPHAVTRLTQGCITAAFGPRIGDTAPVLKDAPLATDLTFNVATSRAIGGYLDPARTTLIVLEIEVADDRSAFRLAPRYVALGGALNGALAGKRDLTATVSFVAPSAAEGTASGVRAFSFTDVTIAGERKDGMPGMVPSSWMPLPALSEAVQKRVGDAEKRRTDIAAVRDTLTQLDARPARAKAGQREKTSAARNALIAAINEDTKFLAAVSPYTIQVQFAETKQGSPFLVKLGELLAGNADKIAAPLVDAISPEKRAAAREADAAGSDTLRIAVIEADTALAKASGEGNANAIRVAEIRMAAACRQLGDAGFAEPVCLLGR